MKNRTKKPPTAPEPALPAAPAPVEERARGNGKAPPGEVDRQGLLADQGLVVRCLSGEVGAWEELYGRCHGPLLLAIEMMLDPRNRDPHLVDEIAARVWYALVGNDGELLSRYDTDRGARLITFMRAIARDEISRYFRTERRRRDREQAAIREKPQHHAPDHGQPTAALDEFLATLTPHERGFFGEHLLCPPSERGENSRPNSQKLSAASAWQLTHRIHRKLLEFLDFET